MAFALCAADVGGVGGQIRSFRMECEHMIGSVIECHSGQVPHVTQDSEGLVSVQRNLVEFIGQ